MAQGIPKALNRYTQKSVTSLQDPDKYCTYSGPICPKEVGVIDVKICFLFGNRSNKYLAATSGSSVSSESDLLNESNNELYFS